MFLALFALPAFYAVSLYAGSRSFYPPQQPGGFCMEFSWPLSSMAHTGEPVKVLPKVRLHRVSSTAHTDEPLT